MAELPRMPTDCAKLIGDTTYMSTEEFGAYSRILFTMWLHGGRLRDDERELARITGLSLQRWRKIAKRVCTPLTFAAGEVSQKRLTATWLGVQELRRKHQVGASKRWSGHQNAAHHAEHRAQHKHIKDSNIKPSESESGTARAHDAEAPQDSRWKNQNVASPQLEEQLRRVRK